MRFPRGTDRATAQAVLAVHAEFGGWELDRTRVWPDGTRQAVLRRPRRHAIVRDLQRTAVAG